MGILRKWKRLLRILFVQTGGECREALFSLLFVFYPQPEHVLEYAVMLMFLCYGVFFFPFSLDDAFILLLFLDKNSSIVPYCVYFSKRGKMSPFYSNREGNSFCSSKSILSLLFFCLGMTIGIDFDFAGKHTGVCFEWDNIFFCYIL